MQHLNMNPLLVLIALHCHGVLATPSEYWAQASPAVRHVRERLAQQPNIEHVARRGLKVRDRNLSSTGEDPLDCGDGDETTAGAMWWTAKECSRASRNLTYVYKDPAGVLKVRTARKGELIKMKCDNWECPVPRVPNCYLNRSICHPDQWCMVETHEKWGHWATGYSGHTPDFDHCGEEYQGLIHSVSEMLNLQPDTLDALYDSRNSICNSTRVNVTAGMALVDGLANTNAAHTWMPSRGKCVRYRQEGESCILTETASGPFNHTFIRRVQASSGAYALGGSLDRPLACAPGLVCTGPDFDVLPSTCVKARPADLCYAGPWWNSTRCPRTAKVNTGIGMDRNWSLEALRSTLLLYAGEVQFPSTCSFWHDDGVEAVRMSTYKIIESLWPKRLVGPFPNYSYVKDHLFQVGDVNLARLDKAECEAGEHIENSDIAIALATAGKDWSMQPNLVWSLIHFVMHNQPSPMPQRAVQASRAFASHLSENFWCNDCRGFFTIGVLSAYGLPPDVADGEAHARYWNFGHNVASEHVATTRGGHPWINSAAEAQDANVSNPFYVPYVTSVEMWHVSLRSEETWKYFYDYYTSR